MDYYVLKFIVNALSKQKSKSAFSILKVLLCLSVNMLQEHLRIEETTLPSSKPLKACSLGRKFDFTENIKT